MRTCPSAIAITHGSSPSPRRSIRRSRSPVSSSTAVTAGGRRRRGGAAGGSKRSTAIPPPPPSGGPPRPLHPLVIRQTIWIAAGTLAMVAMVVFDYRTLATYAYALYFTVLGLLGVVSVAGQ